MPPSEQGLIMDRLVSEISTARTLEKALYARRLLLTGRQVPEVYATEVAREHADASIAELDQEIDSLLMEIRARREVVSDSVVVLLQRVWRLTVHRGSLYLLRRWSPRRPRRRCWRWGGGLATLTRPQLDRLIDQVTLGGSARPDVMAKCGHVHSVAQAAPVIEPVARVVWWDLSAPALPGRWPWSPSELAQLRAHGAELASVDHMLQVQARGRLRPFLAPRRRLVREPR
jgi:hypothetical protein